MNLRPVHRCPQCGSADANVYDPHDPDDPNIVHECCDCGHEWDVHCEAL